MMKSIDPNKILLFLEEIMVPPNRFHQQIVVSMSKIFGYRKSIIWKYADNQANLYEPVNLNIENTLISRYLEYYHKVDMFHPKNIFNMAFKKRVLYITDIMSPKDYENSDIYLNLSRKHDIYHNMAAYFFHGSTLLGAMSLLRSPNEKGFTKNEAKTLHILTRHISKTLASNMLLEDINYQKKIFEAHSNHSPIGLLLLDQTFNIHYFNPAAREICADLSPGDNRWLNPIEGFINKYLKNNIINLQTSEIRNLLSPSFKRYTMHTTPDLGYQSRKKALLAVYLIPQNISSSYNLLEQNSNDYNLTNRELEIIDLVSKGYSNQQIADALCISLFTVKTHMQNIFKKMGVKNRTSLIRELTF